MNPDKKEWNSDSLVVEAKRDYAMECFNLSRQSDLDEETNMVTVERLWIGDLANYIVSLENKLAFANKNGGCL